MYTAKLQDSTGLILTATFEVFTGELILTLPSDVTFKAGSFKFKLQDMSDPYIFDEESV